MKNNKYCICRHKSCSTYKIWKKKHPRKASKLVNLCKSLNALVEERINANIEINGRNITICKTIRSKAPKCLGTAKRDGCHPFTCKSCYSQKRYLLMKFKKSQKAALRNVDNRFGKKGMRHEVLSNNELRQSLQSTTKLNNALMKDIRLHRTKKSWGDLLMESAVTENHQKLIMDIRHLLQEHHEDNFRIEILRNLASKLRRGRNHHYPDVILKISVLLRNLLGRASHAMISVSIIIIYYFISSRI